MIDTELNVAKKLYPFQEKTVASIMEELEKNNEQHNILYQLPTGGGKTVIFSELSKQYIEKTGKKVLVLTHRIELSVQTSQQLLARNVDSKIINSSVKTLDDQDDYKCFIAMVETLHNRLNEDNNFVKDVGLVIVDEAHYNSFRKLFQFYKHCNVLGVTATPLSSNKALPLNDHYNNLLVGESITSLIENNYLADGNTFSYDVNLQGLKIGTHGDFTVRSLDHVYGNNFMQEKLISAYDEIAKGQKTLIFNAGIETSLFVEETFKNLKYNVKHLDSTLGDKERKKIISWFRNTPDAILTSVGILTTGFDEPEVRNIILNRATRSLTLYHQMIGRGSRWMTNKKEFNIIDLGNNVRRFGLWQDYINWHDAFRFPDRFLESRISEMEDLQFEVDYLFPKKYKEFFDTSKLESFSIADAYYHALDNGIKGRIAIDQSMQNHFEVIKEASSDFLEAKELINMLQDHIEHRLKHYTKCITKSTPNYLKYLQETYNRKLSHKLRLSLDID